jgi:hypothetical protein
MDIKVIVWVVASLSLSYLSYVIYKIIVKTKKERELKKFSNPMYAVGAAVVNMERAIIHGDDENFKFFARYAIRASMGMEKSYPPDEPSAEKILLELQRHDADKDLVAKAMGIYTLGELPDDIQYLNSVVKETTDVVRSLCVICKIASSDGKNQISASATSRLP